MMEKINIAELLKDCPSGMELDCTLYDNCTFERIEDVGYIDILVKTPSGIIRLTKEGCYIRHDDYAKCVIFPKGKTTWEGFVPPCQIKDGDVVSIIVNRNLWYGIYQKEINAVLYCYASYSDSTQNLYSSNNNGMCLIDDIVEMRFATEEEKQKLFDAIKANGYKWNEETKTLEELPKFKVDDKLKLKGGDEFGIITQVADCFYTIKNKNNTHCWPIKKQDDWELVPNKFDIATLKPFDKVLVRDCNKDKWNIDFFGYYRDDGTYQCMTFTKNQCIPYEVNKELLGTTNNPKGYGSE